MYLQSETIPGFQEIKVSLAELTPTAHKDEWMFGMVVTSLSIDGRLQHPLLCISKEVLRVNLRRFETQYYYEL